MDIKMDMNLTFKVIKQMIKQYQNLDDDELREKSTMMIYKTFDLKDIYIAQILFDLSYYGDGVYLSDTDDEIEYKITIDGEWIRAKRLYDSEQCIYDTYSSRINDFFRLIEFLDNKNN